MPESSIATIPRAVSFPIKDWQRYECIALLGEGGMGSVYKARDPRLDRYIALKFIRGNEPALIQQFFWEAQLQARVDHPNVCKVYEVGDADGHPFIAMQYIDGEPFYRAAAKMSLEQRVKAIADVAEGLHAAHKLGLIHRDIKPANILVERTSEGAWRPYLVDFGLARDMAIDGKSVVDVEGTPAYMAPEQVKGILRQLDRRTDVYGVGSTMYEILVGQPPFSDESLLDVIWKVVNEPPTPIRKLDRGIPIDLETIVMKCLEKEPQRRYDSAKALALDLLSYLEGNPIQARPASWLYRAMKRAMKNKLATAASTTAFVLLGISGVVVVRTRLAAAHRAEVAKQVTALAQNFGQDVKEMELFMRYAYALPLHDVSREKEVIRTRMAKIKLQMQTMRESLGSLVEGPGNYALGCGHLALHEPERALLDLEQAFQSGYASSEAMFAAGLTHGFLYRKGMDRAQRLPDMEARAAYQKQMETQHLAPALGYLRKSVKEGSEVSLYTSALISLYEKRFDDALTGAKLAFERSPWEYEAKKLEGDVRTAKGDAAQEAGKHASALAEYRQAIASYEDAAGMATSDPNVYDAAASAWSKAMLLDAQGGARSHEAFAKLVESCDNAIRVEPRDSSPYAKKAWAYVHQGNEDLASGVDPRPNLNKAIDTGKQAIEWDPSEATAYDSLGASYYLIAAYEGSFGADTRPSLKSAVDNMEKSIALDPNSAWAWNDIGIAYGLLADYDASHGADPVALFELSAAYHERAIDVHPKEINPYLNQGWFYALRARYELDRGRNPEESLSRALELLETALSIRSDTYGAYGNLGYVYLIQGQYERLAGQSPDAMLSRALDSYQAASRLDAEALESELGAGTVYGEMALTQLERGVDPTDALEQGAALVRAVLARTPDNAQAYLALGQIELVAARSAARRGSNPSKPFDKAEAAMRRALTLNAGSAQMFGAMAKLHRYRSEWAADAGQSAREDVNAGLAMVAKALAIDPGAPRPMAIRGALLLLRAQGAATPTAHQEAARGAASSLEAALRDNPLLRRDYEALWLRAKKESAQVGGAPTALPAPQPRQ